MHQSPPQDAPSSSSQLFLLKEPHKHPLPQKYDKILGYCPMLNNTCVILAIKSHCVECVAHIDHNGKLLKEILFYDSNFYPFVITSDHHIVWVHLQKNYLLQWNLQTYQLLEVPFEYLDDSVSDTHQIFVFPEMQLICVLECGRVNSNIFKLSYLTYPLTRTSQPIHTFQSTELWNYEYIVKRGNTKSMFILFKPLHQSCIEFTTFELEFDEYKDTNQYKDKICVNKVLVPESKYITIGNIWQCSKQKYMIIAIRQTQTQFPNPLLIFQKPSQTIHQSKIKLPPRIVDMQSFNKTSMIRTLAFEQQKVKESQIYYIDNQNQCISACDSWVCTNLNKYVFPAYDSNMIVDAKYKNGDVELIQSESIRVVCPRQIVVYFLQEIVGQPVSEDLLAEVCLLIYGY